MAAGQQRKRLNASSFTRLYSREQPFPKRKKVESPHVAWNLKPHISLKWDDNKREAVARREQIGIAWRELFPYVKSIPSSKSALADVFPVPEEIFHLDNLNDVLSYEVWEACLSESERDFLIQFLPEVKDSDEVVQPLLMGENLHFGNPLDNWSAHLISGKLHPDAVLHHSRQLKANKNSYYDQIKRYHDGLIQCVLNWKERWESCKDPVKEIAEKIWSKEVPGNSSMSAKPRITPREQSCDACGDPKNSSRYISCIKISKRQHQLVKNIKSGGDGILQKSLSRVLGDLKCLRVQQYEEFEADERRRLHEHWLKLVWKDLPLAFEEFRKRTVSKEHCSMAIENEISQRLAKDFEVEEDGSYHSEPKQVKNTECKEEHEPSAEEIVYVMENENSEGSDMEFSASEKGKNSKTVKHHERGYDMDSSESGGESESSEREILKGSPKRLDLEKKNNTLIQQLDASEKTLGNLGPQGAEKSQQTHLPLLGDVCSSPQLHEEHLKRISLHDCHQNQLDSEVFDYIVIGNDSKLEADASQVQANLDEHLSPDEDDKDCRPTNLKVARNLEKIPSLNRDPDPSSLVLYEDTHRELLDSSGKQLSHFPINLETTNIMKRKDSDFSSTDPWAEVGISVPRTGAQGCSIYPFHGSLPCNQSNRAVELVNSTSNLESKLLLEEVSRIENEPTVFHPYANIDPYQNIHMPSFTKEQDLIMPPFLKEQNLAMAHFSKEQLLPPYSIQQFNNVKRPDLPVFGQSNALSPNSMYHISLAKGKNIFLEQNHVCLERSGDKELYIQQMANKADFSKGRAMNNSLNGRTGQHNWLAYTAGNGGLPTHNLFSSEIQPRNGWPMIDSSLGTSHPLGESRSSDGSLYSILPEFSKTSLGLSSSMANPDQLTFPSNFASETIPNFGTFSNNGYGFTHTLSNPIIFDTVGSADPPKVTNAPWVSFPPHNSNFSDFLDKSNTRIWKQ